MAEPAVVVAADARVERITEDTLVILAEPPSACPRCADGRGCGAGLFQSRRRRTLRVPRAAGFEAAPGSRVSVTLPRSSLNRLALLGYGLPLAAFVATVALLSVSTALADAVVAALALLASGAAFRYAGRRHGRADAQVRVTPPQP